MSRKLRLAINTGGGDAPGLNAVLRAVTLTALNKGFEVIGHPEGLSRPPGHEVPRASHRGVRSRHHPSRRIHPRHQQSRQSAGHPRGGGRTRSGTSTSPIKRCQNFRRLGLDGLIAVGGDGSLKIAAGLGKKGIPIIGVPKTIDNDLAATYDDLRLRHRGGHGHRRHRQAALHGREPRARHGGGGDGPLLRLDRALRRHRRLRRRDPDPGDPLRHRRRSATR